MDAKTTPEYLKSNAVNMPDAIALSYKDESGNCKNDMVGFL